MNKLQLSKNKTLKLTNVLRYKLPLDDEDFNFDTVIEQMEAYIRTKGALQIGPLVQYTNAFVNEDGELDMELVMMLQCNNFIHSVEPPYSMDSVIRVSNCMYCRYMGPEDKLKFAYDKINMEMTYNGALVMPKNYAVMTDDEMCYTEGGIYFSNSTIKKATAACFYSAGINPLGGVLIGLGVWKVRAIIIAGYAKVAAKLGAFSGVLGVALTIMGAYAIVSIGYDIADALIQGKGVDIGIKKSKSGIPYGLSVGVR